MVRNFFRSKIVLGAIVLLLLASGWYLLWGREVPNYQLVTVSRGSITEAVSVTGNTAPVRDVSLGFENSGTIGRVYASVGKEVTAGTLLAELKNADLMAQLKQAEAQVSIDQAKLAGLEAGARPEDIASSEAALSKAEQDLANLYASISDIAIDARAKANDAVRTQLHTFFSNAETATPTLTFDTNNSQKKADIITERIAASKALNDWQSELNSISTSGDVLMTLLNDSLLYLSTVRNLLNSASVVLDGAINLSAATLSTNRTAVVTAQNEVNTATKNLNTVTQEIASQKLTVAQLRAQLELKKAGESVQDIDAQKAQVKKAEANVASIEAKLQNSRIIAPINGTITQFDAKVGQIASPSVPLVTIIGASGFEVNAGVSEADIGKIALNDKVMMTIDAFPGETFEGSVTYIAPAETNTQGVINYEVKTSFTKADPRLKSGLTANLTIVTDQKEQVLLLPQYALLQNDQGAFVQVLVGGEIKDIPVTLGIQDQNGNVEILSGVSEGDQVLNVGLKKI